MTTAGFRLSREGVIPTLAVGVFTTSGSIHAAGRFAMQFAWPMASNTLELKVFVM